MFSTQVIFDVAGGKYSFNSMYVRSVEAKMEIKPFPGLPDVICGVAELRGEIIPVCDLHRKFNVGGRSSGDNQIIFVNTSEGCCLGCLVDSVVEIGAITEDVQLDLPYLIKSDNTAYVDGIVRHKEDFVTAVHHDRILSADEQEVTFGAIRKAQAEAEEKARKEREAKAAEEAKKREAEKEAEE